MIKTTAYIVVGVWLFTTLATIAFVADIMDTEDRYGGSA